jgi:hypothetical protein
MAYFAAQVIVFNAVMRWDESQKWYDWSFWRIVSEVAKRKCLCGKIADELESANQNEMLKISLF